MRSRGLTLRLLVCAAALCAAVSACAGAEATSGGAGELPGFAPERIAPAPPPPPQAAVRVVDGDTGKPVGLARVSAGGQAVLAGRDGVASLAGPRPRALRVTVSAGGYEGRSVRLLFGQKAVQTVDLWRPALQWPLYGANAARTQAQSGIELRPPFRVVWKRELYGLPEFPAVVWDGVAYVNNMQGWLRAISMKNGHVLWKKRVGSFTASSPALDPARGIVVTTSIRPGYVNVLSMRTGRIRWHYYTGWAEPSPVIRGGVAYFGATNGNVYALDLDRRRTRWIYRGGVKITSSPALVGNRLYFGDYAGRVFALDSRTGRVRWQGSAGTRVYGTVAVAGGRVFVPSVFSGLSALSARTGRLLWRVPVGAYLYSSPAVFRGRVYFGTYAGVVYCASAASGQILWRGSSGGRVSGAVEVVAGVVYAGSLENRITAWNWRSGHTLWTFPHGRYVPVSGNGARLLLHGPGQIWAVEPKGKR